MRSGVSYLSSFYLTIGSHALKSCTFSVELKVNALLYLTSILSYNLYFFSGASRPHKIFNFVKGRAHMPLYDFHVNLINILKIDIKHILVHLRKPPE